MSGRGAGRSDLVDIALRGARPYPEENLRTIARIIGAQSAAAQALAELTKRRAAGEDVTCCQFRSMFIVGPRRSDA